VNVGRFIENVDFRATKADTRDPAISPSMQPMLQHEVVFGVDWAITPNWGLETRYSRKRLDRTIDGKRLAQRGDIRHLPAPLKSRLIELANRPHTFLPITAFSEAAQPSQLFQYYLIDTTNFQPNVFTSIVPGINDTAAPTAANAANGGLPPPPPGSSSRRIRST